MLLMDKLLGQTLTGISGSVYFENYEENAANFITSDIVKICLFFDKSSITIGGNASGDNVVICENDTLHDIDMDIHGYIKVLDLVKFLEVEDYIGLKVYDIERIGIREEEVGVAIIFSNIEKLIILNLGDELFYFKNLPKNLVDEGYKIIRK